MPDTTPAAIEETRIELFFSVDAALLAELGERLVGEPYIALGELIKNGYDADAHNAKVTFEADRLIVEDDGHGMTFDEFETFWMRVGSTHKHEQRLSRNLERPLTGSKGVGRLSVQFLAKRLTLITCGEEGQEVEAMVHWPSVARAGAELVKTSVAVVQRAAARNYLGSATGTKLVLEPGTCSKRVRVTQNRALRVRGGHRGVVLACVRPGDRFRDAGGVCLGAAVIVAAAGALLDGAGRPAAAVSRRRFGAS